MRTLSCLPVLLLCVLPTMAAQAEVRMTPKVATVAIAGASFDEAAAQFDRLRATTFGSVEARFDASYTLRFYPGWCQVTGAVVEASVSGAVPQWSGGSGDAAARRRWDDLTAEVRNRADAVERDARAAAQEMDRQILAMPSLPTCDEVKARASQIVDAVRRQHLGGR